MLNNKDYITLCLTSVEVEKLAFLRLKPQQTMVPGEPVNSAHDFAPDGLLRRHDAYSVLGLPRNHFQGTWFIAFKRMD